MALASFIVFLALLGISSSTGDTKSSSIKGDAQERNFGLIRPQYPNNNNPWNTGNTYPGYRPNPGSGYQPYPTSNQQYPNFNQQYPNFNQQYPNYNQQYPNYNQQYPNYNQQYPTYNQQYPNYNQQLYPPNNGWNRPTGTRPTSYSG